MVSQLEQPIFSIEQEAIAPSIFSQRWFLGTLAGMSIVSALCPILLSQHLPKGLKTMLLGLSTVNAIAFTVAVKKSPLQEKIFSAMQDAQVEQLRGQMGAQIAVQSLQQEMLAELQVVSLINQLPPHMRDHYLDKTQLFGLAEPVQTIPVEQVSQQPYQLAPSFEQKTAQPIVFDDGTVTFPEEDIALEMARTTTDPKMAGSTLIACPSGTGKSNLLRAAIAHTNAAHDGNVDFYVFSGKDGETYCGLEKSEQDYIYSGDRNNVETVRRMAEAIASQRCRAFAGFPTINVWDEYNNTLAAAAMFDKANKAQEEVQISGASYEIITKGRSKLCLNWMTSHSPQVQDLKINTAIQQSLNIIVLGRGNKYAAIKDVVSGKRSIIEDEDTRASLYEQFKAFMQSPERDRVLCLTNINGDWRLVFLPRYPDEQPEIERGILNQSGVEIDNEPPTATAQGHDNPYKAFKAWYTAQASKPTNAQCQVAWKQITGIDLNEQAIAHLLSRLDQLAK